MLFSMMNKYLLDIKLLNNHNFMMISLDLPFQNSYNLTIISRLCILLAI